MRIISNCLPATHTGKALCKILHLDTASRREETPQIPRCVSPHSLKATNVGVRIRMLQHETCSPTLAPEFHPASSLAKYCGHRGHRPVDGAPRHRQRTASNLHPPSLLPSCGGNLSNRRLTPR